MPLTAAPYDPAGHNPRHVSRIRLFVRSLGICFFSLLSLGLAFYAFLVLPQVQDLFLDVRPYWIQEAIYWAWFYTVGIAVWACPLVFTARLLFLQNFDVIGIDTEARFKFYVFRMPSFFVVLAFAAVFLGVIAASDNVPFPTGGNKYEAPIRRLVETHLLALFIASGLALLLVIIRDQVVGEYSRLMEGMEQRDPDKFRRILLRIERLTRKDAGGLSAPSLHLMELKPDFLSDETWIKAQRIKVFMWRYMSVITWLLLGLVAIHFLSYSDTLEKYAGSWKFPAGLGFENISDVLSDTIYLKRASFLFVLFGAWLPFVTILALLSNRFQFPFIAALFAASAVLTIFTGDGHDLRITRVSPEDEAHLKPVTFAAAVNDWKQASGWDAEGCEPLAQGDAKLQECPRPIIVAGEGGGSRAAFLLASLLGAIEDDSLAKSNAASIRPFHNQLFAISSVSGSSVGAALFVSALKVQPGVPVDQVKKAVFKQRLWFPNVVTANTKLSQDYNVASANKPFLTDFVTYKDALQAVLSNDFISPDLIAYLARDSLMLSRLPFVMDRAGVLETSWEDAFNSVYGTSRASSPLSAPVQNFGPSAGSWTPLLFFNSTSTDTGRRIIVTPVKTLAPMKGSTLFADAYDLHELLCSPYPNPGTNVYRPLRKLDEIARKIPSVFSPVTDAKCVARKPVSIDARLSTAASVSARSPFISPHAGIRDREAQAIDDAVDGGFFDNSGGVTALEIATALKAADQRLLPFIVQISSEPDWFKYVKDCGGTSQEPDRPRLPDISDFRPIGSLMDLLTVNATRIARSYETILELPQETARLNNGVNSIAQFHICPQPKEQLLWESLLSLGSKSDPQARSLRIRQKTIKETRYKSVSLSWWLSPPLQAYLDGQIYAAHNAKQRNCVLDLLRRGPAAQSTACE
jgi:hypothetical protein